VASTWCNEAAPAPWLWTHLLKGDVLGARALRQESGELSRQFALHSAAVRRSAAELHSRKEGTRVVPPTRWSAAHPHTYFHGICSIDKGVAEINADDVIEVA
jgi:hypothetical protein